ERLDGVVELTLFTYLSDGPPNRVYVHRLRFDEMVGEVGSTRPGGRYRRVPIAQTEGRIHSLSGNVGKLVEVASQRCIDLADEHEARGNHRTSRVKAVLEQYEPCEVDASKLFKGKRLRVRRREPHVPQHLTEAADGAWSYSGADRKCDLVRAPWL